MEENKDLLASSETEEVKAAKEPNQDKKPVKEKKNKTKKLKSQLLLKRGGYSLAITALFLAAVIIVNVLVTALSKRFDLEFDLSADKVSTVSEDNIKFIKNIKQNVDVTVCADAENYPGFMTNAVQPSFGVMGDYNDYYKQTVKLINKYKDYNKKVNVNFVDMYNDPSFDAIQQKFAKEGLKYGDIIISTTNKVEGEDVERYKVIRYNDIYDIRQQQQQQNPMMGSYSTISGNDIETALTSGIAYVLGSDTKKVSIISGHSSQDIAAYIQTYSKLLTDNGFEVEIVSEAPIAKISDDTDVIAVLAPINDFLPEEIQVITQFLDNNGVYGKGLVYFGSSVCPVLPNFNDLLADWGIESVEGKLYMSEPGLAAPGDPYTIKSPLDMSGAMLITSANQPFTVDEGENKEYKASAIKTAPFTVIAPTDAGKEWADYKKEDFAGYPIVAQSKKETYNDDNEKVSSSVLVFSSLDFITSQYAEQQSVLNKDMTLAFSEEAVQAEDTGIKFVSKEIKNESFASEVTESGSATVRLIFMILLPLVMLAIGIFIFIRRKNA